MNESELRAEIDFELYERESAKTTPGAVYNPARLRRLRRELRIILLTATNQEGKVKP